MQRALSFPLWSMCCWQLWNVVHLKHTGDWPNDYVPVPHRAPLKTHGCHLTQALHEETARHSTPYAHRRVRNASLLTSASLPQRVTARADLRAVRFPAPNPPPPPPPVPSTLHLCTHRPPSNMKGTMLTPGRYLLGQVLATLGTQTLHDDWVAASFDSHQNRSRNEGQKAEIRRETLGLWFLTPLPEREEDLAAARLQGLLCSGCKMKDGRLTCGLHAPKTQQTTQNRSRD